MSETMSYDAEVDALLAMIDTEVGEQWQQLRHQADRVRAARASEPPAQVAPLPVQVAEEPKDD